MADLMAAPSAVARSLPAQDRAPAAPARRPSRDKHLWQIDVVRLLTFAAVISVHSLAYTAQPSDTFAAGLMMVLQFGREVFFALTGFVLVYSTMGRELKVRSFWRKRFLYVGVPYVAWTGIYYAFSFVSGPHLPFSWHVLGVDLLDGNAEYHLYFLVVSMQLYLVFPLLRRLVLRTAAHPWRVLVSVGLANAGWLAAQQWLPWPTGWESWFWRYDYVLLPTYAIYVLLGCYAAVHREALLEALRRHRRRVIGFAVAGLAVTEIAYLLQTPYMQPRMANQDIQPVMILGSVSAVLILVCIGDAWAGGRRPGLQAIKRGSQISFGVYLCHPFVLTLLCNAGLGNGLNHLPTGVATVLAYVGTVTGAVLIGLVLSRTPLSLALIGRDRSRDPWPRPHLHRRTPPAPAVTDTVPVDPPVQPIFRSH